MANKNENRGSGMGAVAGVGALLAAAAGAYWLYGAEDAAKHRKVARSWMLKARAEVMDAVEKAQKLDKKDYLAIVDKVVKGSAAAAAATRPEIALLTRDLRTAWIHMQEQLRKDANKTVRTARSSAKNIKKSAKKAVKKSTRK